MSIPNDLKQKKLEKQAEIGARFLHHFDMYSLQHDVKLVKLIAELDQIERQIKVTEMPL